MQIVEGRFTVHFTCATDTAHSRNNNKAISNNDTSQLSFTEPTGQTNQTILLLIVTYQSLWILKPFHLYSVFLPMSLDICFKSMTTKLVMHRWLIVLMCCSCLSVQSRYNTKAITQNKLNKRKQKSHFVRHIFPLMEWYCGAVQK